MRRSSFSSHYNVAAFGLLSIGACYHCCMQSSSQNQGSYATDQGDRMRLALNVPEIYLSVFHYAVLWQDPVLPYQRTSSCIPEQGVTF
jgi:hypothetical protein